jgi:hypothetical protein
MCECMPSINVTLKHVRGGYSPELETSTPTVSLEYLKKTSVVPYLKYKHLLSPIPLHLSIDYITVAESTQFESSKNLEASCFFIQSRCLSFRLLICPIFTVVSITYAFIRDLWRVFLFLLFPPLCYSLYNNQSNL